MAGLPNLVQQYSDLHVSHVRTHDLMGPTDVDSKFEWTNKELTDLIPDSAQRAGVVKAGNASLIFPDMSADPEKPDYRKDAKAELESARNAAYIGAALCYFQNAPLNKAHFYRGDAAWMGLFDLQGQYFKTAYTFKAAGSDAG